MRREAGGVAPDKADGDPALQKLLLASAQATTWDVSRGRTFYASVVELVDTATLGVAAC